MQAHRRGEAFYTVGFQDPKNLSEGGIVVGQIGKIGNAPIIGGELDDVCGKAAGATGVEKDRIHVVAGDEPTGGISRIIVNWNAQAGEGGVEIGEAVILKGDDPLVVICERSVDAAVAFGGGGDALVTGDDGSGAVFGVAHGAMEDRLTFFVYGRVVHQERAEDAGFYEFRVGLVSGAFDDEGKKAKAGVAIAKAGAWWEIG